MAEAERGFNPPPPLSTPKEAPWTNVEQVITLLGELSTYMLALVKIQLGYPVPEITVTVEGEPGEPGEPGAPGAPGEPGTPGAVITAVLPVLQRDAWDHGQENVTTPGSAQQLPDLEVPPGFDLVVRAKSGNTGDVYVGKSLTAASRAEDRITLAAGEAIKLKISNASLVYVDAATADDGVEYFAEI